MPSSERCPQNRATASTLTTVGHGTPSAALRALSLSKRLLLPRLDQFRQQRVQPQPPPQREAQERLAKIARPLHAHAAHIDHLPARPRQRGRWRLTQAHLRRHRRPPIEQRLELLPPRLRDRLLAGELAQRRHHLLARPRRRAPRLAQRPIFVGFPSGMFAMAA